MAGAPVVGRELLMQLRELTNEINKIGVNINQIVRKNNSNLYSDIDKSALFRYMNQIEDKLDTCIKNIEGGKE